MADGYVHPVLQGGRNLGARNQFLGLLNAAVQFAGSSERGTLLIRTPRQAGASNASGRGQFDRGVASNSFACLHGLTEDVRKRGLLGEVEVRTHAIDESVRRIPLDEIARRNRAAGCRALACLVGVQTKRARTAAVRHCRLGVGSAYGAAESHDWPLICARGG